VGDLLFVRADWLRNQCCPRPASSAEPHRVNIGSFLCRHLERYREKIFFGQFDDHLLVDIGVDVQAIEQMRARDRAVRRLSLIANGGGI